MRLIDVDKITSGEIAKYLGRGYEFCAPDIEDMLREQPTAYDVEAVAEQLQGISDEAQDEISVCEKEACQYYDGFSDGVDKAIEIVNRGGRDEDYWK